MSTLIRSRMLYKGLPLSRGVAVARICMFNEHRHSNLPMYKVEGAEGIERERSRLERAVELVGRRLDDIRENVKERIGAAEAEIFTAQRMILEDEALQKGMFDILENEGRNAEAAVTCVLDKYEARLREVDNEYIRERASDIGEIKRRVLDVLQNMQPSLQCAGDHDCQQGRHRIIVAEELTPSLTVDIDTSETLGFITEHGGKNSHAAILARSLGIPAVSGIENIHSQVSCGTEILVDGDTGEVIVWPDESDKKMVSERLSVSTEDDARCLEPLEGFCVQANISLSGDAEEAVKHGAEGIGLYRTEFEFMAAGHQLDEDEQAERYIAAMMVMDHRPVTFRLLDMGGDKPFSFLDLPEEENPALGWRGSRLLLGHHDILRKQARALARASQVGPVRVMYPMVTGVEQFLQLRSIFNEAIADIETGELQQGVMFEVPSACLEARELLEEADFGSIGTNDLIQYLFAVDRDNDKVAYDYSPDAPVLWKLIRQLVEAAEATGKDLSVCGEIAGEGEFAARLYDVGIRSVSVSPRLIPRVREAILNKLK